MRLFWERKNGGEQDGRGIHTEDPTITDLRDSDVCGTSVTRNPNMVLVVLSDRVVDGGGRTGRDV